MNSSNLDVKYAHLVSNSIKICYKPTLVQLCETRRRSLRLQVCFHVGSGGFKQTLPLLTDRALCSRWSPEGKTIPPPQAVPWRAPL